jgi:hypothetical protein
MKIILLKCTTSYKKMIPIGLNESTNENLLSMCLCLIDWQFAFTLNVFMLDRLTIRIFLSNKVLKMDKKRMKSIELVELDMESVLFHLELSLMRIRSGFNGLFMWFGWFSAIWWVKMGTRKILFWLESIELVELDLEPVLESSGMLHRRIGPGFSVISWCFGWFNGWRWGLIRNLRIGIDRAPRVVSGICLESSGMLHRRIGPGFPVISWCFGWFWVILWVKVGTYTESEHWNQ